MLLIDPLLSKKEINVSFWKKLAVEKCPFLRDIVLKMLSVFGITYICECTFSCIKHIKTKERNCLTDETSGHLLRVSTSEKWKLISWHCHLQLNIIKPHIKEIIIKKCTKMILYHYVVIYYINNFDLLIPTINNFLTL